MPGRFGVCELSLALLHDPFDLRGSDRSGQIIEPHGLLDGPEKALGIECVEQKSVAAVLIHIQRCDGVVNSARVVRHGQRPVYGCRHLRQAARFERRGHEDEIRSRIGQVFQLLVEIADRGSFLEPVKADDITKDGLIGTIGNKDDLQILLPPPGDHRVEDICQQLAPFLDRIQPRGPEKKRRLGIFDQAQVALQKPFVGLFGAGVVFRAVGDFQILIGLGIEGRIRRIQDAGGAVGVVFVDDLLTQIRLDETVAPLDDLGKKMGADRVDEVRRKNTRGEKIHRVLFAGAFVVKSHVFIVKVLPEEGRVDAAIFDVRQRAFDAMDIVDGKQARNTHLPRHGRNQSRHPVVAVNQVRLDDGYDVVHHLPHEGERHLEIVLALAGIDLVEIKKGSIFGQVDPVIRHLAFDALQLFFQQGRDAVAENPAVVGNGHMHVRTLVNQRSDQRGRNICQPTGFGGEVSRQIPHAVRQISDLGGDDQYPGIGEWRLGHLSAPAV